MIKGLIKKRKIVTVAMVLLLVVSFVLSNISVNAANTKMATLTGDLNVRKEPKVGAESLGIAKKGESYIVIGEAQDDRPVTWYKITFNGKDGWISSAYATVKEIATGNESGNQSGNQSGTQSGNSSGTQTNEEFEAHLKAQKFPADYETKLRALHKLYPNWVFEAQHTGLDWNTVIKEEYQLGRNMVSTSSIASWKSTQNGAYNWATGKWIGLDGSSWVAASEGIIAHYMDPRNFLDATNVFQFLKQSYNPSKMTAEEIAARKDALLLTVQGTFLAGTYMENNVEIPYVDTLMEAAAKSGVCPLTLASMIIQEQGVKGTGKSISGTVAGYEGFYNFFNVGAYATSSMTAIQRGLWYASGAGAGSTSFNRPWNTRTASIIGGSVYYGANYVAVGQDTMYLKKFNVQGNNLYNHQYMTNVQGAASEGQHVAEGYNEASRAAKLVFKIPVYKNMPTKVAAKPTGNLDPNYMLKSLKVGEYSLTPTFSIYETEYAVTVPYDVPNTKISATPVSSQTKVTGAGDVSLKVGENVFEITTKAQNEDTRTYKLTIIRQERVEEPEVKPEEKPMDQVSITSSVYSLNEDFTITGIKDFPVDTKKFIGNLTVANGTVQVLNEDGSAVTGNIGTGDQVLIFDENNTCQYTYHVLIFGDVNGDGNVNARDLLVIQKHNIQVSELTGDALKAADVNRDGKVNAKDLLAVQKSNIKISVIEQ